MGHIVNKSEQVGGVRMWKGVWVAEAWAGAGARVGTPSKQSLIDLGNGHTGTPPPPTLFLQNDRNKG